MLPYVSRKNSLLSVQKYLLLALLFLLFNATPCFGQEIPVELVWKFDNAGWLGIQIEEGNYQIHQQSSVTSFPAGSYLECAWGGLTPILRLNDHPFQVWKGNEIDLQAEDSTGVFQIKTPDGKSVRYYGSLTLSWAGNHWSLINKVDREAYLKGVVPIEMSNIWAQDGLEALKAQAVAARTFVVKKLQTKRTITDSPDIDQAYLGKEVEGSANRAIEATEGEVLVDSQNFLPIDALYSSHNGGYTEKAENVWNNPDPHFSSHPDPFSKGMGGAADRWRFIIGADILGKSFGLDPVQKIQLSKYASGRVKTVKMTDLNGISKEVSGRTFVQAFYPYGHPLQTQAFLGVLFEAQKIPNQAQAEGRKELGSWRPFGLSAAEDLSSLGKDQESIGPRLDRILSSSQGIREAPSNHDVFIFQGHGWGHGVGMSQWGAYHMAQLGYSYPQILNFYYNNIVLVKK
ncbi:SpoIID/LytB domain-containing protein [Desulfitobacterium sp. Sab5]|uniref:SpoIID/LytB domain-containing protein n=1 Tax=Desulfitobacterium nosdiversum TaxID=3375356 RepID=UPI003CEBFA1B